MTAVAAELPTLGMETSAGRELSAAELAGAVLIGCLMEMVPRVRLPKFQNDKQVRPFGRLGSVRPVVTVASCEAVDIWHVI